MTEFEYNRMKDLFSKNKDLKAYYIKLKNYINIDGYDRREFHDCRNVYFDNNENICFDIENWSKFKSESIKVNYKDINLFIPSNSKKDKRLPIYLQDINFKEGFRDIVNK